MKEYLTDAVVLDADDSGDLDKLVYLYTPILGKVKARARSLRKITSKLAGHLEPLSIAKIRLVEKNGFQVVDAILIRQFDKSPQAIELAQFIKEMTFEGVRDKKFWLLVKKAFDDSGSEKFSWKPLLKTLGFAPDFAVCSVCGNKPVSHFSPKEQLFFCKNCASKIPKNEVILVE